jgi:hypothetical protein
MESPSQRLSSRLFRGLLQALLLAGLIGLGSCAHTPDQELVGDPISAKTQRHTATAKEVLVVTVRDFTLDYDRAVCRRDRAQQQDERMRQAVSEAYIELTRAVEESARVARRRANREATSPLVSPPQTSEPSEPPDRQEGDGIIWLSMDSRPDESDPAGGQLLWFCSELTEHRSCVDSAANATTRALWQHFGEPADLEPDEVPQAFDALAAEFDRGFSVLTAQPSVPEALQTIAAGCREGKSPLANYLERKRGDRDGRARMADRLRGQHATICQALPQIYEMTAQNLRHQIQSRLIDGRCRVDAWTPLAY